MEMQAQFELPLGARAEASAVLQNLGKPLSRVEAPSGPIPWESPIPNALDLSTEVRATRTKKCCKGPLPVDRIASEVYPIDAQYLKDLRPVSSGVFGSQARMDGRDPVAYRR